MSDCTIENAPAYLTKLLTEKSISRLVLRSYVEESLFFQYDGPFNKNTTFYYMSFNTALLSRHNYKIKNQIA